MNPSEMADSHHNVGHRNVGVNQKFIEWFEWAPEKIRQKRGHTVWVPLLRTAALDTKLAFRTKIIFFFLLISSCQLPVPLDM